MFFEKFVACEFAFCHVFVGDIAEIFPLATDSILHITHPVFAVADDVSQCRGGASMAVGQR